jgi:hypothetical protein
MIYIQYDHNQVSNSKGDVKFENVEIVKSINYQRKPNMEKKQAHFLSILSLASTFTIFAIYVDF